MTRSSFELNPLTAVTKEFTSLLALMASTILSRIWASVVSLSTVTVTVLVPAMPGPEILTLYSSSA
jgi:hypothetical protein